MTAYTRLESITHREWSKEPNTKWKIAVITTTVVITTVNHDVSGIARDWRCDKHNYLRAYVYLFYKQQL